MLSSFTAGPSIRARAVAIAMNPLGSSDDFFIISRICGR